MSVVATVENMKLYRREPEHITTPEGETVTILAKQPFAWSPNTDERCSADPGDYFYLSDSEPLTDSEGEPMYLVFEVTTLIDADEYASRSMV